MPLASANCSATRIIRPRDPAREAPLAQALSISGLTAHLLLQRGMTSAEEAKTFLYPTWDLLPDLRQIPDIDQAVKRLTQALAKKEKVLFYGDYDLDGISGTAQLVAFFRELGFETEAYLPHRLEEGYGLNLETLKRIVAQHRPDLLVTIDNGTNAFAEISFLQQQGVDVIVIDHHETPKERPPCVALLNPKRADSSFSEPVASAGLVYLLLIALRASLRNQGLGKLPNLRRYLDLACLGTIADVVPLLGLNRLLVKEGLRELAGSERPGLIALMKRAEVRVPLSVGQVSFRIAPRLNAAGRLADPRLALDLLLAPDETTAQKLADQLERLNQERQQIEAGVLQEAIEMVEREQQDRSGIVVGSEHWHLGVVGIVAAKLVERFGKPSIVLTIEHDIAKGSARTIPGFSLYDALHTMADTMIRYGGHHAAAGMTLKKENLSIFAQKFDQAVRSCPVLGKSPPAVDALLTLKEITPSLLQELALLGPHGPQNPEPIFSAENVRFEKCRVVGKSHLKATLIQDGVQMEAIGFNLGPLHSMVDKRCITFQPGWNEWNGLASIQLMLKNIYN